MRTRLAARYYDLVILGRVGPYEPCKYQGEHPENGPQSPIEFSEIAAHYTTDNEIVIVHSGDDLVSKSKLSQQLIELTASRAVLGDWVCAELKDSRL